MKNNLPNIAVIFTLLCFPNVNFAQAPNLGTVANFVLFSVTGAIGNTGVSYITGNVGTNTGAITSFSNVDGVMHSPDGATAVCAADLLSAYAQLNTAAPTSTHSVLLGSGETLHAGVYSIPAAASVNNTLTLDAQGNENAVFIFQIGGAFSSGASAQINLINCAKASNVFWKIEGAVSLAAGTIMKGTIIANNAAISLGAGVILEGRALSTTGAVAVFGILAYIPIESPFLTGHAPPGLASTACYALFSANGLVINTGISAVMGDIGTNSGTASGYNSLNVTGTIHPGPDVSTGVCAADLLNVYNYLDTIPYDIELLYPAQFGNSLVLTPHTYLMSGAVTFTDTLFLNAEGNANAVFVIKTNGPISTGANAKVVLTNGAQARNVFWKVEGAVTLGVNSDFKGTIVCNNGAIVLNAGTTLEGRAFTTTGALTTSSIILTAVPAASISYARYTYCSNGGTASVTVSGSPGGIYSSSTGLVIDSATGTVNLAQSVPGAYTVTYSVAAAGGCSASYTTAGITIAAPPSATISYPGSPFCSNTGIAAVTFAGTTGGTYSSLPSGASVNPVTGAVDLSATAPGRYNITYTITRCSGACGDTDYTVNREIIINPNTWTGGISSNWYTPGNWAANALPVIACPDVTIPAGVPYQPVLNSGVFAIGNLFIKSGATLTIDNATLQIAGTINNSGTFTVYDGSVEMNGTQTQTIPANAFQNNALNNLIVSNSSTDGLFLRGDLDIYGSLTFTGTDVKLTTNDSLTLKSTATNTASIGNMTGNSITGNVTVERYIFARKAWYFLSVPTNTIQTVKQSWQEGAVSTESDPAPGYGIQITGPGDTAAGFDLYSSTPSMKTYNSATNTWVGIPNTNTATIRTSEGYMTFIRGGRTANTFNSLPTQTVVRTKGNLYTGDQVPVTISSGKFGAIGNPYASAVDMRYITKTGTRDFFYIWDPNLGGAYGLGGYQTFSNNGSDYVITPGMGSYGASGSVNNNIQSGQAFLVQAALGGGSVTFTEEAKPGDPGVISIAAGLLQPQLRTDLYGVNTDSSIYIADGILNNYGGDYSNSVDDMDAIKLVNPGENLSIKTNNQLLAIERRQGITGQDTIMLNLTNTKLQRYRFKFVAGGLDPGSFTGYLEDGYLHTRTLLNLDGTTTADFSIVNIAGSYAPDRFRIVFTPAIVLPLSFIYVKAYQESDGIAVEWKVENESNMKQYEVEKSLDGNHYEKSGAVAPGNSTVNNYSWLDTQAIAGYNYYRIKSVSINGEIKYSAVVKVAITKIKGSPSIAVYPNPETGNRISVLFVNIGKGTYTLQLFNAALQLVGIKTILHTATASSESFEIKGKLAKGMYDLKLAGQGIELTVPLIKR
ncbi:MAG: ice-binding family protein [Ginsengibacter sp.]